MKQKKRWTLLALVLALLLGAKPHEGKDFSAEPISASVLRRMQGKSYPRGCPVRLSDLRYVRIRHYNAAGKDLEGELVCHKDIAADLVSIFRELYRARYPIERVRLIDDYGADDHRSMAANNTSAFCYRRISGSKRLSNHSQGRAVDINPLYNPMVSQNGRAVSPPEGRAYANRSRSSAYKIVRGDLCYRLFRRHGFSWGGDWKSKKDYQHFEKN